MTTIIMGCMHRVAGMVPLWIFTLGRLLYSHTSITVPYQNILYSLVGLIIAVGLGLLIKHKRPRWAAVMVTISKVLMVVFLLFVLTVGVYANLYIFRLMSLQVRERGCLCGRMSGAVGCFMSMASAGSWCEGGQG